MSHLFRWDESLAGVVDLTFNLAGDDSDPQMRGDVAVSGFQYKDYFFQELEIDGRYSGEKLSGDIAFGDGTSEFPFSRGHDPRRSFHRSNTRKVSSGGD